MSVSWVLVNEMASGAVYAPSSCLFHGAEVCFLAVLGERGLKRVLGPKGTTEAQVCQFAICTSELHFRGCLLKQTRQTGRLRSRRHLAASVRLSHKASLISQTVPKLTQTLSLLQVALLEQARAGERFRRWAAKRCPDAMLMNVGSDIQIRQLLFGGKENNKPDSKETLPLSKVFKVSALAF